MSSPNLYSVSWNERTSELPNIVADLMNDQPVLLKIEGIPDAKRCAFAHEMMVGDADFRPKWSEYMSHKNRPPKTVGYAQLTTLQPSDTNANEVWHGLCRTLRILPDCATGTTIVGNVIRNAEEFVSDAHWHSPPVINVHVYGSAYKEYKFKRFENMSTAQKTFVKKEFDPDWTATIGRDNDANAIIFPSGMYHEITTHAGDRFVMPRKEDELENINRYIGVAVPLRSLVFLAIFTATDEMSTPDAYFPFFQSCSTALP